MKSSNIINALLAYILSVVSIFGVSNIIVNNILQRNVLIALNARGDSGGAGYIGLALESVIESGIASLILGAFLAIIFFKLVRKNQLITLLGTIIFFLICLGVNNLLSKMLFP